MRISDWSSDVCSSDLYFGYLQNELWRAIRLVTDTGLHSKDWTREQVIKYMLDNSAASKTQATAEAERYIAWPGQALAYKIGELKIQSLRTKRSEEQTTELQSQMRDSSHLFCSKKTK